MEHQNDTAPSFNEKLKKLTDTYAHKVYDVTKNFPRSELFGLTSQLQRSALSVALNYIEGYARRRKNVFKNFIEIAYGSLKESAYLIEFSYNRGYITEHKHKEL